MLRKLIPIFFLVVSFMVLSAHRLNHRAYKVRKIVIDAGHGGKDSGCLGVKKTKESTIALAVALKVGQLIQSKMPDVKVIYTRDKDEFIELHDRAGIANKNTADLFISIHCNAAKSSEVMGTETYTMGLHTSEGNLEVAKRENEVILNEENYEKNYGGYDPNSPIAHIMLANYQSAYLQQSLKFATYVEDNFKEELGRPSRGVKQAGFLVLWKTTMPSSLIELGYLTNEQEEKLLKDPQHQDAVALSIFNAIKKYKTGFDYN